MLLFSICSKIQALGGPGSEGLSKHRCEGPAQSAPQDISIPVFALSLPTSPGSTPTPDPLFSL